MFCFFCLYDTYLLCDQVSTIPLYDALNFSWQGGGTLPQNSYKPFKDLREATQLGITMSVDRVARSVEHTDAQTYFLRF